LYTLPLLDKVIVVPDKLRKNYFIQQYVTEVYLHGGIGCVDAERILLAKGFEPIFFPNHNSFSLSAKAARFLFLLKIFNSIKKNSVVVFFHPVYARMNRLLLRLLYIKGVKLISFIVDIEGIRDSDKKILAAEITKFKTCNYFIVHNDKMKSFIKELNPNSICSVLCFFDYLVQPLFADRGKGDNIVFAGNLEKSKFLSYLNGLPYTNLHFNIYGPGIPENVWRYKNIEYHGIHKPGDIFKTVKGSFGLIWDGESIDSCTGSYGEYLRYNSPHKLSLYVISNLPIIVWEEAASAELVKKYEIGFTIKTLHEIEDKINILSETEYRQMQINMQPLAEKLSKGEFLSDAIDGILKQM
jgi:hypothetical protein